MDKDEIYNDPYWNPQKPDIARNSGWSVYDRHMRWAKKEAERLTKKYGRRFTPSQAVQYRLDHIIRHEKQQKKVVK